MIYLPILTYHRLLDQTPTPSVDPHRIAVSAAQFRNHLKWLKRLGYRTIDLAAYVKELRAGRAPGSRTFAITFDDGYTDVLTLALPLLKEFGFTATVFAVPGQLGGCNAWDDGKAALLTAEQLRTLDRNGVTVGAHTSHHAHLTQTDETTARREIADSKKKLEEVLGRPVPIFAYPYGETNDSVDRYAREAGFEAAFVTDRSSGNHAENPYRLRRVVIFPRNNPWEILWKVQPWYPAYQDWRRSR